MNVISILLLVLLCSFSKISAEIVYSDPVPDAKYVNTNTGIILGFDSKVEFLSELPDKVIIVTGNKSGVHHGKLILIENGTKILFRPSTPFSLDELVNVKTGNSLKYSGDKSFPEFKFSFSTQTEKIYSDPVSGLESEIASYRVPAENSNTENILAVPHFTVTISNNPAPGRLFLSNIPNLQGYTIPYLIIAENTGAFYTSMQMESGCMDFKKQPNGNLTYYKKNNAKFYELNTNYQLIDSFYCGNGYSTDMHELRVLNNGHALLMSYDYELVDMSSIVEGGNTRCMVTGLIIQEIDENKNVVFQWRSWDHFSITDAVHENMLANQIDYVHGNALELDNDGNLLLSSRNLDEITKISRSNGSLIWRLGGVKNQFGFINDPGKFNYQHAIRRIANGNITLFDNGNFHSPPHSRAVEYSLNETDKTATLVWQFRHTPDVFGSAMGFVQRLPGGNTLISWGNANTTITEVRPDGTIALEMNLPQNVKTYRAFKDDWNGDSLVGTQPISNAVPSSFSLEQNFPNPFNPSTEIKFSVKSSSFVKLGVFDITGKEVKELVNSYLKQGSYSFDFDAETLSSGIYIYTLQAGGLNLSKKMVLLK